MDNIERNSSRSRPLSPHLTIYKPQISSMLSIMHRMTGVALFFGALILLWWMILCVYSSFNPQIVKFSFFHSKIGKFFIFGWSAALFYHLLNGIRHLFWDLGFGFKLRSVNISGVAVILGTIVLTLLSWFFACNWGAL